MKKKARGIINGRNAQVSKLVRMERPMVLVRSTYNPAPTRPAPPVPLPHAAKENGP